eukprot:GHRR01017270.1.p1 GENE.GHRR01017270.1~~GHRR01017270.1.p1  ORF type:complete len:910 (+),score=306.65 GHRR01017270.1:263-2992(+)
MRPQLNCHKVLRQSSMTLWVLWLVMTSLLAMHPAGNSAETGPARFFLDEGYFLEGDTEILRAYISASSGRMEISGESSAAFLSVKGYYVPEKWDVYWTIRQACHKAYAHMKPNQFVNCIPGVHAMSLKRNFVQTWQQAYGEAAFHYIPRTYLVPEQYWLWRSYLLATNSPPDSKWVLKANVHRGKGVAVVPQHQALHQALTHSKDAAAAASKALNGVMYHNILMQQYLEPQLVIAGRNSYIRVWMLVTSITPLRAYLFKGGVAIFGKQKGNPIQSAAGGGSQAAAAAEGASSSSNVTDPAAGGSRSGSSAPEGSTDDLIVNLWIQDRNKSPIWSLQQLEEYLDKHPEQVLPLPGVEQQPQQPLINNSSSNCHSNGVSGNSTSSNSSSSSIGTRRTFADAWVGMQTSASLVLAAALPSIRAAAEETKAPSQGMFEYFGLDFVLDAYLRPWLLEVNAVPSMARRKQSNCSGQKATSSCQLGSRAAAGNGAAGSNSSSSGGSSDGGSDFDNQKEFFMHDMLVLLNLPVDAPTPSTRSQTSTSSSNNLASTPHHHWRHLSNQSLHHPLTTAGKARAARQQHRHHHRLASAHSTAGPELPGLVAARKWAAEDAAATAARTATSADSQLQASAAGAQASTGAAAANGVSRSYQSPETVPTAIELPKQLQQLLCSPTGQKGMASRSSRSSSNGSDSTARDGGGGGGPFVCVNCLTAADLAALAAAEAELQRAGRFVPIHNVITAHNLNRRAAGPAAATAADGAADVDVQPGSRQGSSSGTAANSSASGSDGSRGSMPQLTGDEYLSENRGVWQRLYHTWLAMSTEGVGLRDLSIMKYYTTASQLAATGKLNLSRLDYVMSAWLQVRHDVQCTGQGATAQEVVGNSTLLNEGVITNLMTVDCLLERLQRLVSWCYLD